MRHPQNLGNNKQNNMNCFSLFQHRAKMKAIDFQVKMKTNVLILETLMRWYKIQSHGISAFIGNIIWMEKLHYSVMPFVKNETIKEIM